MTLVEVLPKDRDGNIIFSPGGVIDGKPVDGIVNPDWLQTTFPLLASAVVPLTNEDFIILKEIDIFWNENANRWRNQGII